MQKINVEVMIDTLFLGLRLFSFERR